MFALRRLPPPPLKNPLCCPHRAARRVEIQNQQRAGLDIDRQVKDITQLLKDVQHATDSLRQVLHHRCDWGITQDGNPPQPASSQDPQLADERCVGNHDHVSQSRPPRASGSDSLGGTLLWHIVLCTRNGVGKRVGHATHAAS